MSISEVSGRAQYESLTRGDLIDLLCARDASAELPPHLKRAQLALETDNAALRRTCEALERERVRLSALFLNTPAPCCVLDRVGVVLDANTAVARLFGRTRDELVGAALVQAMELANEGIFADHISHCLDDHVLASTMLDVSIGARRHTLHVTSTPSSELASHPACLTTLHDVTSFEAGERDERFLALVNESLVEALDLATLGAMLVRACVPTFGDVCFVDVKVDSRLRRVAISPPRESAAGMLLDRHAHDHGWRTYAEGVITKLDSVFEPTNATAFGAPFEHELGARGFMLVPLTCRNDTFGVLGVLRTEPNRAYAIRDFERLLRVARVASIALARLDAVGG